MYSIDKEPIGAFTLERTITITFLQRCMSNKTLCLLKNVLVPGQEMQVCNDYRGQRGLEAARWAHNPEVVGSMPGLATLLLP